MSKINTIERDHDDLVSITGVIDRVHSGVVMAYPDSATGQLKIKQVELAQSGVLLPNEREPGGVTVMLANLRTGKGQMALLKPEEARALAAALLQSADEYAAIEAEGDPA